MNLRTFCAVRRWRATSLGSELARRDDPSDAHGRMGQPLTHEIQDRSKDKYTSSTRVQQMPRAHKLQ
eukprot:5520330-Pleurochrysis_carterae.AAC.2